MDPALYGEEPSPSPSAASVAEMPRSPIGKRTALRKRVHEIFLIYCVWGRTTGGNNGGLTNANYVKLLRDADVGKKRLSSHVLDCVFAKHCRDGRMLAFRDFENALIEIASRGQMQIDQLYRTISALPGPTINSRLATQTAFAWDGDTVRPVVGSSAAAPAADSEDDVALVYEPQGSDAAYARRTSTLTTASSFVSAPDDEFSVNVNGEAHHNNNDDKPGGDDEENRATGVLVSKGVALALSELAALANLDLDGLRKNTKNKGTDQQQKTISARVNAADRLRSVARQLENIAAQVENDLF